MTLPETEHGESWFCYVQAPLTMSLGRTGTDLLSSTRRTVGRGRRLHLAPSSKAMETCVQTVSHSSTILGDSSKNYIWGKLTIFHPLPPKADNLKGMTPLNMQPTRPIPEFQGQSLLFLVHCLERPDAGRKYPQGVWGMEKTKDEAISKTAWWVVDLVSVLCRMTHDCSTVWPHGKSSHWEWPDSSPGHIVVLHSSVSELSGFWVEDRRTVAIVTARPCQATSSPKCYSAIH